MNWLVQIFFIKKLITIRDSLGAFQIFASVKDAIYSTDERIATQRR